MRPPGGGPNTATRLFRLKDRKGADMLLGPTHEELFALTVKGEYSSYKDLPVILYQIQTKYRDEERPRAGIMRGREFVMKDSYSFDLDDAGLESSYHKHRAAYQRIFSRLQVELRDRRRHVRCHGRQRLRGVPRRQPGGRGHLRPLPGVRVRRQRRGGDHPGAGGRSRWTV
ncbi:MAG: hypothetical protein QM775_32145 [Pirellulales bacterium]